jgi:hypothetical protein
LLVTMTTAAAVICRRQHVAIVGLGELRCLLVAADERPWYCGVHPFPGHCQAS